MSSPKTSPTSIEDKHHGWIPILELATQEVFETMLSSHLAVISEPCPEKESEMTGMVGLAGLLTGVLTIRCSKKSGTKMAAKMLGGEDADKVKQEVWDAMGEICNMVAGNFKNKVAGLGDGCMLSVPTVVSGGDYSYHSYGDSVPIRVNFTFEGEEIAVALEVQR
jgi:chemotaxis protein CheX